MRVNILSYHHSVLAQTELDRACLREHAHADGAERCKRLFSLGGGGGGGGGKEGKRKKRMQRTARPRGKGMQCQFTRKPTYMTTSTDEKCVGKNYCLARFVSFWFSQTARDNNYFLKTFRRVCTKNFRLDFWNGSMHGIINFLDPKSSIIVRKCDGFR
jgi:hypothetical protein